VKRNFVSFPISNFKGIQQQMLSWASRFDICCFLDNHQYRLAPHSLECILAVGGRDVLKVNAGSALDQLRAFTDKYSGADKDWLFGHFGYGLARETEPVHRIPGGAGIHHPNLGIQDPSSGIHDPGAGDQADRYAGRLHAGKTDPIGFPDLCLFVPEIVIELTADRIRIGAFTGDQAEILEQIGQSPLPGAAEGHEAAGARGDKPRPEWTLQPRLTLEEYLQRVMKLQEHILRGDCYEINFCQEFFAHPAVIDPLQTWWRLSRASPNPFAAFYKLYDSYLLCASPERYLKKTGDMLISQPIKGTSPRVPGDPAGDQASRDRLYHSAKDRAENVMVVDLVRNDLSKICREGTVRVEELYGVYSFPNVHQMVSTIKGQLLPGMGLADCIRASFPMGSMTGAPKNRVVGLIEAYESAARGIFSGAVGYIGPEGDFDFNVVIRSILYNSRERYLAYQVGSGITYYSDPAAEYAECLWKAEGIKKALGV
jgi:para-aminobenzoate synthetase component I